MSFVMAGASTPSSARPSLVLASAVGRTAWSRSYAIGRRTDAHALLDADRSEAV